MNKYEELVDAEHDLEEAVIEAFGGIENIPFSNWYFDYYDYSVELQDIKDQSFTPKKEALAKLLEAGICKVYISYPDNTGIVWVYSEKIGWTFGKASPNINGSGHDRRGLVIKLRAQIKELEEKLNDR